MSLEKRQVFPNLFRYACDSCPFDWPRAPVKESDLPPPPSHSCPNENRPDLKPVLEEQEKGTGENTRPKPVAVFTRGGAISYAANLINGQSAHTPAGHRALADTANPLNAPPCHQSPPSPATAPTRT